MRKTLILSTLITSLSLTTSAFAANSIRGAFESDLRPSAMMPRFKRDAWGNENRVMALDALSGHYGNLKKRVHFEDESSLRKHPLTGKTSSAYLAEHATEEGPSKPLATQFPKQTYNILCVHYPLAKPRPSVLDLFPEGEPVAELPHVSSRLPMIGALTRIDLKDMEEEEGISVYERHPKNRFITSSNLEKLHAHLKELDAEEGPSQSVEVEVLTSSNLAKLNAEEEKAPTNRSWFSRLRNWWTGNKTIVFDGDLSDTTSSSTSTSSSTTSNLTDNYEWETQSQQVDELWQY